MVKKRKIYKLNSVLLDLGENMFDMTKDPNYQTAYQAGFNAQKFVLVGTDNEWLKSPRLHSERSELEVKPYKRESNNNFIDLDKIIKKEIPDETFQNHSTRDVDSDLLRTLGYGLPRSHEPSLFEQFILPERTDMDPVIDSPTRPIKDLSLLFPNLTTVQREGYKAGAHDKANQIGLDAKTRVGSLLDIEVTNSFAFLDTNTGIRDYMKGLSRESYGIGDLDIIVRFGNFVSHDIHAYQMGFVMGIHRDYGVTIPLEVVPITPSSIAEFKFAIGEQKHAPYGRPDIDGRALGLMVLAQSKGYDMTGIDLTSVVLSAEDTTWFRNTLNEPSLVHPEYKALQREIHGQEYELRHEGYEKKFSSGSELKKTARSSGFEGWATAKALIAKGK